MKTSLGYFTRPPLVKREGRFYIESGQFKQNRYNFISEAPIQAPAPSTMKIFFEKSLFLGFHSVSVCDKENGMPRRFWLMKSEPLSYSIEDLERDKTAFWDGVRNYQARNFMMQDMRPGDPVLFYHSNAKPPGVAGLAVVALPAKPDVTAFDKSSQYYDPRSTKDKPRWFAVTVRFKEAFPALIPLERLRGEPALKGMLVLKKGQRLSVQPVEKPHYDFILRLARKNFGAEEHKNKPIG